MYIRGIHVPMCLGDEAYFVVSVCAMLISYICLMFKSRTRMMDLKALAVVGDRDTETTTGREATSYFEPRPNARGNSRETVTS